MEREKEPEVGYAQAKGDLEAAKKRLAEKAEGLSIKACMGDHPYITLGAAFFAGFALSGSRGIWECVARAAVDAAARELFGGRKG